MIADSGASVLRCLYVDNNSRNPKARRPTQFVNNGIYNWTASAYILGDTEGRSDGYLVGNYFITSSNTNGGTLDSPTPQYHVYALGNRYDSNRDGVLNGRLLEQGDFGTITWLAMAPNFQIMAIPILRCISMNWQEMRWFSRRR